MTLSGLSADSRCRCYVQVRAVADPAVTIGGTAVNVLWPESETPY